MRKRSSTDGRAFSVCCLDVQGYVHIDIDGALSLIRPIDQDRLIT